MENILVGCRANWIDHLVFPNIKRLLHAVPAANHCMQFVNQHKPSVQLFQGIYRGRALELYPDTVAIRIWDSEQGAKFNLVHY